MATLRPTFLDTVLKRFSRLKTYSLLHLLLFGVALRLVLAPFTSHPYDIAVLYRATNDLLGGLNIYTTNSFSYPPLWPYIEYPLLDLAVLLIGPKVLGVRTDTLNQSIESWKLPPVVTSPLFNILSKLPLFAADLLIGIIIYDIVKNLRDEKCARLSFTLWFLNPLVIYIDCVHGQFDVLPALMTVLSFCLFCRHRYLTSGIAIGLGTLFKIYPVFLVPLYLFSAAKLESDKSVSISKRVERIFVDWSKLAAGMLFSFCAFLTPLINSNIAHDILNRTIIASLGGLTIFNIVYAPGLQWLLPLISSHSELVSTSLLILLLVLILLVSLISFFKQKDFLETFILGHVAVLLATYLTSLTVNAQYIIWILPFLILSYGLYNYNLRNVIVLSLSALAFLIGLSGPLFFFYPLAIFTPTLKVELIYANTYFFKNVGGWIILLVSGIVGVIVLLSCLRNTLAFLLGDSERSMSQDRSQKKRESNASQLPPKIEWRTVSPSKILALALMVLMIGQFLAWTQPSFQQNVGFSIIQLKNQSENIIEIEYRMRSGSYPVDLQIFATPVDSKLDATENKSVFIYYDDAYPSSFVSREGWIGLLDHTSVELKLRGYNGSVEIVNAEELRNIMKTNNDSVIIIPSGVLPETVHAGNESLVGDWVRSGGTLIWMGDAFGYLSGRRDGSIELFSENNYSRIQNQILGFTLFNESSGVERYASISSNFSIGLDLQYTDAIVGALTSNVLKFGGIILGKVTASEDARTSISYLPVGKGHLIIFGGGIGKAFTANGEDVIAHDIAQILCSGFPFSSGASAFNLHELSRNEARETSLDVPLPQNQNVTGIMISAFSKSSYSRFFSRQF